MELYQNPNHLTSFIAEHLEIIATQTLSLKIPIKQLKCLLWKGDIDVGDFMA